MRNRKAIKTSIDDIVRYWFRRVDESELSVDAAEAHEKCWGCGCERNLERCNIVPDSFGGKDEPSNLVLLCKRFHADGPNVTDPDIMWDWIKSYRVPFYDTFWSILGQKEYEFIYKKSVVQELEDLGITEPEEIKEKFAYINKELIKEASIHFGQPYFNTTTVAGMYRMFLKRIEKELGKELPPFKMKYNWWM